MNVDGKHFRTIWVDPTDESLHIIDQRWLPHEFRTVTLKTSHDVGVAIRDMWVRGAPLIGAAAAHGLALSMKEDPSDKGLTSGYELLMATRPTAVNLRWALDRMHKALAGLSPSQRYGAAFRLAQDMADEDVSINQGIARHGLGLIRAVMARKPAGSTVNILTHCNAGWLATVDHGTATAPIYAAHDQGLKVHVYVDETRPRNQGAQLTAWELGQHGVPHTLISDNAGGHLMQHGKVDLVIVGTDRTSRNGDVANKIGTYLKALAAHDNQLPFYVALPSPTIDWSLEDGVNSIPIEERSADEVHYVQGLDREARITSVRISPLTTPAANPAFDVTPARLITGLITERGVAKATGLSDLFPEHKVG